MFSIDFKMSYFIFLSNWWFSYVNVLRKICATWKMHKYQSQWGNVFCKADLTAASLSGIQDFTFFVMLSPCSFLKEFNYHWYSSWVSSVSMKNPQISNFPLPSTQTTKTTAYRNVSTTTKVNLKESLKSYIHSNCMKINCFKNSILFINMAFRTYKAEIDTIKINPMRQ